jgi:type VII secretion-associated protein (TIGR03931 family)
VSGTPVRVAVQLGAATVRVAGAEADGEPWLVAELPAPGPGVAGLLAELVGPRPEELVLVHPGCWPPPRAAEWALACAGLAGWVWAVPAPLAAAGRGGVAVLDVGHAGAEATRLGPDGAVRAWRTSPVGGRSLDELLRARLGARGAGSADARRLREALSLLPAAAAGAVLVTAEELRETLAGPLSAAVDALRDVLVRAGPAPVLLVGGVARAPLLAELVDAAGIPGVAVAPRPDAAAVLGALVLPREIPRAGPPRAPARGGALARRPGPPPVRWLPPLPPRRRRPLRAALVSAAAAGAVAGLLAVGSLLVPSPAADAVPAGVLVQYGYRLDVPAGWEHTGGLPERRRILLTPAAAPEGSDLIAVERSPLGYDAGAEPERASTELRAEFDAAVAGGSALSGYDPLARVAGRAVTGYRQQDPGGTAVEWYVVLDGDAQLSVGCRHTPAHAAMVRAACATVVASVRRA